MRKHIVWICLIWILLSIIDVSDEVDDWMYTVECGWEDMAPFVHVSLFTVAIFIVLFVLTSEAFSRQRSRTMPRILNLKKHSLSEHGRVLSLVSKTSSNMTAASNNYLQDICFVELRFNGWLMISLVMLLILGPAVFLIAETRVSFVGILIIVIMVVFLMNLLLRGKLTVGTADGEVMTVLTNKITAKEICSGITGEDVGGFHEVCLSSPFSEKTVHLRKSRITGVTVLSRFPLLLFILFLISTFHASSVVDDTPFALIVPAVLLGIIIFLSRNKTTAKLIGGHYYSLGSRESADNLLKVTTPEK